MYAFTGILLVAALAKKPAAKEETPTTAPAAVEVPPIERALNDPLNYAKKLLSTCTPTGRDLVGRDQATAPEYLFSLYGSGGLAVGQAIQVGPPEDFMKNVKGNRPIDILVGLPVGLFEVARTYAHRSAYEAMQTSGAKFTLDKTYRNFYFAPDKQVVVTYGTTFSTREMAMTVPNELRYGRYRFVDGGDGVGGAEGIYGLVDRSIATLMEARVAIDLLNCGWEDGGLTSAHWLPLFSDAETALFATREMQYYTMQFLRFAKSAHADNYQTTLDNKALMASLVEFNSRADALQAEYEEKGAALVGRITAKGLASEWGPKSIKIGEQGMGRYVEQREKLAAIMADPSMVDIVSAVTARSH